MFADDHTATSESPCSPETWAWTERGSTPWRSASSIRKRAVSRIVPDPMTRSAGRPEIRYAR